MIGFEGALAIISFFLQHHLNLSHWNFWLAANMSMIWVLVIFNLMIISSLKSWDYQNDTPNQLVTSLSSKRTLNIPLILRWLMMVGGGVGWLTCRHLTHIDVGCVIGVILGFIIFIFSVTRLQIIATH